MTVRELIEELLHEDLDENIVIHVNDSDLNFVVIDGISAFTISGGPVYLEPNKRLYTKGSPGQFCKR